jgi:hypothetical protein
VFSLRNGKVPYDPDPEHDVGHLDFFFFLFLVFTYTFSIRVSCVQTRGASMIEIRGICNKPSSANCLYNAHHII